MRLARGAARSRVVAERMVPLRVVLRHLIAALRFSFSRLWASACSPSGQEASFLAVGVPLTHRTEPPPALDTAATAAFVAKAEALAPEYRTELLGP